MPLNRNSFLSKRQLFRELGRMLNQRELAKVKQVKIGERPFVPREEAERLMRIEQLKATPQGFKDLVQIFKEVQPYGTSISTVRNVVFHRIKEILQKAPNKKVPAIARMIFRRGHDWILPENEAQRIISRFKRASRLVPLIQLGKELRLSDYRDLNKPKMQRTYQLAPKKIGPDNYITREEFERAIAIRKLRQTVLPTTIGSNDVARIWGTSREMVTIWIKQGKIPSIKIGKQYRVSKQEFETHGKEWLQKVGYSTERGTRVRTSKMQGQRKRIKAKRLVLIKERYKKLIGEKRRIERETQIEDRETDPDSETLNT